jgi:hypothetical protein
VTKFQRYHKKHPWAKHLNSARRRCNDPKHRAYPWYGGRGIKCRLTIEEVRDLWIRDGAGKLKKASLDRLDSKKDYTFENCRFIEFVENVSAPARWLLKKDPEYEHFAQQGAE